MELFLPRVVPESSRANPMLFTLLFGGRATTSKFDTAPSPLAHVLFSVLGEKRVVDGAEDAKACWRGEISARDFLNKQDASSVAMIARAASNIADTRSAALLEIAASVMPKAP